jgi:type III secretory pathway lipoprotein EscJ
MSFVQLPLMGHLRYASCISKIGSRPSSSFNQLLDRFSMQAVSSVPSEERQRYYACCNPNIAQLVCASAGCLPRAHR